MTHALSLHRAEFLAYARTMRSRSVGVTLTDPPYDPATHENQRKGAARGKVSAARPIGFDALTPELRRAYAQEIERVTRRWAIVHTDAEGFEDWRQAGLAAGLEYVRQLVWVRGARDVRDQRLVTAGKKGAPQFTGDRPAAGHECMVLFHVKGVRMRWNGRGARTDGTGGLTGGGDVYYAEIETEGRLHDTPKPLALERELIRDFTDPGELVFDPFAGSATTLIAARLEGRASLGLEVDVDNHRRAALRCEL